MVTFSSARVAATVAAAGAAGALALWAARSGGATKLISSGRSLVSAMATGGGSAELEMSPLTVNPEESSPAEGAPQGQISVHPSQYPKVRKDDSVVEVLHDTEVADPYRWLEDPDSKETQEFVEEQNKLTASVLEQCPNRSHFKEALTKMMDYPKYGCPFKRGDRYFHFHNSGLQAQYVLFSQASLEEEASVLLDPNSLSSDGTVALGSQAFSEDGNTMAFELSTGGSDWKTIHALMVEKDGTATWLQDKLTNIKFSSLSFTHDGTGLFYNCYEAPKKDGVDLGTETDINLNQQLRLHVMGTPQEEDALIYATPDHPDQMIGAEVTDDGRYLLMSVTSGCLPTNKLYYVDLGALKTRPDGTVDFPAYDFLKGSELLPVVKLVDNFDASYSYVANAGPVFTFRTNLNAPRYKLVRADFSKATPPEQWEDVVSEHPTDLLECAVALAGDVVVVEYLRDVSSVLQLRSLASGALKEELQLPSLGSIQGFAGRRKDSEFFFSFTSLVEPGAVYRCDVSSDKPTITLFRRVEIDGFNVDDYVMKQLFVTSKDGTRVPMFVAHKKSLKLDGTSPCQLYGYGGFNICLSPFFSCARVTFMRGVGGVYASANLRGGGEYGIKWRDAGSLTNKQNVFDDFQACAEHLIATGYTNRSRLFINGGSNGGLLVAACVNQRPDLYAAAVAQVGVMDMLRFHKFTIGHAWTKDFGDPEDPEQFRYLLAYSPIHNVRPPADGRGQYPAVLLTTGDHDDRVVPLHSHKLIATLQDRLGGASSPQRNPLITRVDVKSGHGAGKPTQKIIEEVADMYGFVTGVMGLQWAASG
mmetsp:Transcript_25826/g.72321  ORF Transcript_25826/g.72321 Transcript_25826/m.72321 type:complete len:814 (-) Transcript_25826:260-2701(-)